MTHRFSIIIPVFNDQAGIDRILKKNSEMFATNNCEVIIIDDASNPPISIEKFNFVKLIRNNYNIGVALSRNRGIELAQSDMIIFLDSDDYLFFNYFDIIKKYIDQSDYSGFSFGSLNINYHTKKIHYYSERCEIDNPIKLLRKNRIVLSGTVLRRKALDDLKFRKIKHEDLDLWYRLASNKKLLVCDNIAVVRSVGNKSSVSGKKLQSMIWHVQYIMQNVSGLQRCQLMLIYLGEQAFSLVKGRFLRLKTWK